MKYLLTLLLFASLAWADIPHSFRITMQNEGYFAKTNSSTWSGTRGASLSNVTVTGADTMMVGVMWKDLATDSFAVWRPRMHTDTINGETMTGGTWGSYYDSIAVSEGNSARLDSLVWSLYAQNAVDSGGCTGEIYAVIFDTCYVPNAYSPSVFTTTSYFNDYITPGITTAAFLMDSVQVDTVAFGMGDTSLVTFALTNRAVLDDIACLMNATANVTAAALRFDLISCYDYNNTTPTANGRYQQKVSFRTQAHAVTATRPTLTMYWTEVEPVSKIGMRSQIKEAASFIRSRIR